MVLIHHVHQVFPTVADAEALVAKFAADDAAYPEDADGWVYKVEADPKGTGKAVIHVIDETGFEVGLL